MSYTREFKGAMSPHMHARANENKLEKVGPTFSSSVGDFGSCFYLSKVDFLHFRAVIGQIFSIRVKTNLVVQ